MLKNTSVEYGSVAKFLHWLIFILVLGMLIAGYFMGDIEDKALRGSVINLHKQAGLIILLLMMIRVIWAYINVKPALPLNTARWEEWTRDAVHWAMYVVLILMPVSGWVMSCAAGHSPYFGSLVLGLPVPESKALAGSAFDVHYWIAISIIVLVSFHMLAAFFHHFIRRDDILRRMWFKKSQ